MGAEEKGSHKERVEAMQKKFDVSNERAVFHLCTVFTLEKRTA